MQTITLGFRAYDAHELACHFVARQAGLYRRHGLDVRLTDLSFVPDPPRNLFSAGCGAALISWLGGADLRVVFVAAQRPMFWLYARPGIRGLAELAGQSVAAYPSASPPALLLRAVLRRHAVDPDHITLCAVRDDVARVGLLDDRSAAAALISSAVPPQHLAERGFIELLCIGDELCVPTTGLAVHAELLAAEPDLVAALRRCYREALALIHHEPGLLEAALARFVMPAATAAAQAARVRDGYTRDGRIPVAELGAAIDLVAAELGTGVPLPSSRLYELA